MTTVDAPKPAAPTVVLHRLSLSPSETRLLEDGGVRVVRSRSVNQTLAAVDGTAAPCVVVVSLSVGSQAPEQVVAGLRAREGARRAALHLVPTSEPGRSNLRRAKKLGLDAVYAWPDGAFAQVVRVLGAAPNVMMRRFSERAPVARMLGLHLGFGIEARIVNISTTGAMLESDQTGAQVESVGFEFSVGGVPQPPIFAQVVWREPRGTRMRLGLRFVDVSEATSNAIARFVEETNVMRVGGARAELRPAPPGGHKVRVHHGKRRDYFRLEDADGTLLLVPEGQFFVPYQIGDRVEVVPASGARGPARFQARVIERQQLDLDRIDGRVCWVLASALAGDDGSTDPHGTSALASDVGIASSVARPTDPRWQPLGHAVDLLLQGKDPFAGHSHLVVVPAPPQGIGGKLGARTFTLSIKGAGTLLVFHEHDRYLALPPTGGEAFRVTVGRADGVDVLVASSTVSKLHALLHWNPTLGAWELEDVGSSNGTRIRADAFAREEHKLLPTTRQPLRCGNVVRLGKQRLHLVTADELRASCALLVTQRRTARAAG